jgi:hypothetical protein
MNTSVKIIIGVLATLVIVLIAVVGYFLWGNNKKEVKLSGIVIQKNISSMDGSNKQLAQRNTNEEGDTTYKNIQYGFQLTFPKSWKNRIVKNGTSYGSGRGVTFGFVEQSNVFTVEVYTKDEWSHVQQKRQKGEVPGSGTVLGESAKYIFVEPFIFEAMDGLDKQFNDLDKIRKSFKIIN